MPRGGDRQQLRRSLHDPEHERLPVGEAAGLLVDADRREHERDCEDDRRGHIGRARRAARRAVPAQASSGFSGLTPARSLSPDRTAPVTRSTGTTRPPRWRSPGAGSPSRRGARRPSSPSSSSSSSGMPKSRRRSKPPRRASCSTRSTGTAVIAFGTVSRVEAHRRRQAERVHRAVREAVRPAGRLRHRVAEVQAVLGERVAARRSPRREGPAAPRGRARPRARGEATSRSRQRRRRATSSSPG